VPLATPELVWRASLLPDRLRRLPATAAPHRAPSFSRRRHRVRVPLPWGKLAVMSAPIVPPPGFDDLPVEEKIAYVQALWDLIAEHPDDVPVPEWQQAILEERIDEARSSSAVVKPWSEVRAELRARLRTVRGG
jgi:putative addiction module component (TIGR02574 family)